jgi:hypothetical protein
MTQPNEPAANEMLKEFNICRIAELLCPYAKQIKSTEDEKALGMALVAVRDRMKHGEFIRWISANGFDKNRVYYCIRVFEGKIKPYVSKRKHINRSPKIQDPTRRIKRLTAFVVTFTEQP